MLLLTRLLSNKPITAKMIVPHHFSEKQLKFRKFIPGTAWFLLVTVACCFPGSSLPPVNNWWNRIYFDKWIHAGLFATWTLLWMHPVVSSFLSAKEKKIWLYIISAIICLWGLAIEFIQKYFVPGRSFDWFDWLSDMAGVLFILMFYRNRLKTKASAE